MVTWNKEALSTGNRAQVFLEWARENTGQQFIAGAPIVITAGTGLTAECASDPATVSGIAKRPGRNLTTADALGNPKLPYFPIQIGERYRGSVKEALSTVPNGTLVGLLKEAPDWVFSTTCVNKKFTVRQTDPRAAQADTYARCIVEYTG